MKLQQKNIQRLINGEKSDYHNLFKWLTNMLLSQTDKQLYNKALVKLAETVLEDVLRYGLSELAYAVKAHSLLGHALKMTAEEPKQKKFSRCAIEFAGHLYEQSQFNMLQADQASEDLIRWLDLTRKDIVRDASWRKLRKEEREFALAVMRDNAKRLRYKSKV